MLLEIGGNFDDEYISDLICQNKGSVAKLNNYINNLCCNIIKDWYNPNEITNSETNINFDNEKSADILKIHDIIKSIANKAAISGSIKHYQEDEYSELNISKSSDVLMNESQGNKISIKEKNMNKSICKLKNVNKYANMNMGSFLKNGKEKDCFIEGKHLNNLIELFVENNTGKKEKKRNIFDPIEDESYEEIIYNTFKEKESNENAGNSLNSYKNSPKIKGRTTISPTKQHCVNNLPLNSLNIMQSNFNDEISKNLVENILQKLAPKQNYTKINQQSNFEHNDYTDSFFKVKYFSSDEEFLGKKSQRNEMSSKET